MTRAAVSELWVRIEPILDTALDLPTERWPAFLDSACGGDAALRAAVERLLVTAGGASTPSEGEIGAVAWAQPLLMERELAVPSRIGPYVIDRELGRGGMGAVYLARRDGSDDSPRVALKVMRNGLDQDRVLLRRFAEERQILATLEHPRVARLLEGGVTGDGHPWFAMEYVDGVPLNRYVETRALSVKERLQLFLQIVDAVSYAHANLIVHRDLKPSNVLVTADGAIKLLDFGIAKLLAPSTTTEAITRTGLQPFTPEYASPEQVLGEPVTTSADVYALGVVFYELLTGKRPLDLGRTNPADWASVVRESTPRAPSTVVRDGRWLRGDLDTIALMALRREPDRRYESVERMGDDVRRYLEGRPVLARTDSAVYRTVKFVRRRPASVTAALIIALTIATFALATRRLPSVLGQPTTAFDSTTRFKCVPCGEAMASRAELAAREGDDARAAALADSARVFWNGVLPASDPRWSSLARVHALQLRDDRHPDAAVAWLTALIDTLRSAPHPDPNALRRTHETLADVFDRWGQPDSAAAHRSLARAAALPDSARR